MDDALSMCWDAPVRKIGGDNESNKEIEKWQQTQSNFKEFWHSYNQKKLISKKFVMITAKDISLLRDKANKYIDYTLAIFSFGITLIPTSSSNYSEYDHPSYHDVIKYCEFKFENYKKSPEWIENHNKKFLEERKKEEDERERLEAIELRKAKIERHKQDLEDQKKKRSC